MRTILSVSLFLILTYVLPLAADPARLLTPQILFLALVAAIMITVPKTLSLEDAKAHESSDRHSFHAILIGGFVCQIISVLEWAYVPTQLSRSVVTLATAFGVLITIVGLWVRIWAIRVLGALFTATVQISDRHSLVTTGPYAWVRHPGYLGAYLTFVGAGLVLCAPIGTIVSAALMFLAYRLRIITEEEALTSEFGQAYNDYSLKTKRLIPLIW